jgi:hypothetical protein
MSNERCVHDLLPGQCAPCMGQGLDEGRTPRPAATAGTRGKFLASYKGSCQDCGGDIEPGQLIERDWIATGGYVHWKCPDA